MCWAQYNHRTNMFANMDPSYATLRPDTFCHNAKNAASMKSDARSLRFAVQTRVATRRRNPQRSRT